jgi:type II secretory ATPase GspE/PulE/Tfp pilus assembly ATPase PilB-like protein
MPTAGGIEDVVMRILAAGEPIPLDKLGVMPANLERLKACVSKPYGIFFVCGPTGSGKTTTLHSILAHLNTADTKIWTAEDPVEITQKGLRQVQINKKAGLDFATVMRSFLRADPDIIMVGEMRDKETTAIGIEASLTGHLVFATLHTNSAPESIVRLLDMGMDPFNFADALLGILAQRLAKRLCAKCKEAYTPSAEELQHFLAEYCEELQATRTYKKDAKAAGEALYQRWLKDYGSNGKLTLYRAKGCEVCSNTGYKGRAGLHELLVGNDAVKKLIQEHGRVADLLAQALEDGMRTLKQDGMEKVLQGITDMKQVRAVCIK